MITDLLVVLATHQGKANAIAADCLLQIMRSRGHDLPGMYALRDLVHDARKQKHIIASCEAGYFMPISLEEARDFIDKRLVTPSRDMARTARILRQAAREHYGQQLRLI